MRKLLPELYDEAKIGWSFGGPILGHRLRGGSVKSGVDFYSVEDSFPLLLVPRFRIGSGPRQNHCEKQNTVGILPANQTAWFVSIGVQVQKNISTGMITNRVKIELFPPRTTASTNGALAAKKRYTNNKIVSANVAHPITSGLVA